MGISFKQSKIILLGLLFVLFAVSLHGQIKTMRFTEPFKEDMLTSNMVSCITQDTLGFIWMGTINGLNCFNRNTLQKYIIDINESLSLINNTINRLFINDSGRLWISTLLGLCQYNPAFDNLLFIALEQDFAGQESLQINDW